MLKVLREKAGLTQREFSEKMGYTNAQFISNIERGLAELPPAKFKAAARALGVQVGDLVSLRLKNEKTRLMKRYGGVK